MASKQKNPNIGMARCWGPSCDELVAVRRGARGVLYLECPSCGRIMPKGDRGQRQIEQAAQLWEGGSAPPDAPRWIAEEWGLADIRRWPEAAREPAGGAGAPGPAPAAAPEPAPEPDQAGPDLPPPPPVRQPDNVQGAPESQTHKPAGDDDPDDDRPRSWLDEL